MTRIKSTYANGTTTPSLLTRDLGVLFGFRDHDPSALIRLLCLLTGDLGSDSLEDERTREEGIESVPEQDGHKDSAGHVIIHIGG